MIPEFTEIYSLPRPHIETSLCNRYAEAASSNDGLCMGRHVIGAFESMCVIRFALPYHVVEYLLHIVSYIRIGILINS